MHGINNGTIFKINMRFTSDGSYRKLNWKLGVTNLWDNLGD